MYMSRVAITWWQGNSIGTLGWILPPLPECHQQRIWKLKTYSADVVKPPYTSFFLLYSPCSKCAGSLKRLYGVSVFMTHMSWIMSVPFFQWSQMRRSPHQNALGVHFTLSKVCRHFWPGWQPFHATQYVNLWQGGPF